MNEKLEILKFSCHFLFTLKSAVKQSAKFERDNNRSRQIAHNHFRIGRRVCISKQVFYYNLELGATISLNLNSQIFRTCSIPASSSSLTSLPYLFSKPFKIASFLFILAQMTKGNPNFSLYRQFNSCKSSFS